MSGRIRRASRGVRPRQRSSLPFSGISTSISNSSSSCYPPVFTRCSNCWKQQFDTFVCGEAWIVCARVATCVNMGPKYPCLTKVQDGIPANAEGVALGPEYRCESPGTFVDRFRKWPWRAPSTWRHQPGGSRVFPFVLPYRHVLLCSQMYVCGR